MNQLQTKSQTKRPAGRGDASHRVIQNDMPPLAGLLLSAIEFAPVFEISLAAVSAPLLLGGGW